MTITFDTLKLAQELEASGFSREQATGTAQALSKNLSMEKGTLTTKGDLVGVKTELKEDINKVKAELKEDINEVKADLAVIKSELTIFKWIGGVILALLIKLVFFSIENTPLREGFSKRKEGGNQEKG